MHNRYGVVAKRLVQQHRSGGKNRKKRIKWTARWKFYYIHLKGTKDKWEVQRIR